MYGKTSSQITADRKTYLRITVAQISQLLRVPVSDTETTDDSGEPS